MDELALVLANTGLVHNGLDVFAINFFFKFVHN